MSQQRKICAPKPCATCGVMMERKTYGSRLEDASVFARRRHCSRACGNSRADVKSAQHHQRARQFKGEMCEECRTTERLHVHHMDGNITNNDPSNLKTLCASCHLRWHWAHGKTASKRQSVCKICGAPARKLDMCQKHYQRSRKYGDPCLTKRGNSSGVFFVREASDGSLYRC